MPACTLTIQIPGGSRVLSFTPPVSLYRLLADNGVPVDMPCGGRQRCLKCKAVVSGGVSPMSEREAALLTAEEKAEGLRFACMAELTGDAVLRLSGGAAGDAILTEGAMPVFTRAPWGRQWGTAVDIGTTTVAAYLYRLADGALLATQSEKNPQAVFGADVVSRLEQAMNGKSPELAAAIRECLSRLLAGLCGQAGLPMDAIDSVVLTGNTAMLYLLTERHPASIVAAPFAMDCGFGQFVAPQALALPLSPDCRVYLPACLSAYVGADITTALLAAGFYREGRVPAGPPRLLVDIGTNGEMVLGNRERMIACATAAGPALEGAKIRFGMRGEPGAIDHAALVGNTLSLSVIGGGEAAGICGSGLIDIAAVLLNAGVVNARGRLAEPGTALPLGDRIFETEGQRCFRLTDSVYLTQDDIRQLQMAKGAIASGIELMAAQLGGGVETIERVLLAGAFGSFIRPESACRIGLLPPQLLDRIQAIGNAAGSGARRVACSGAELQRAQTIADRAEFLELAALPEFQRTFAKSMRFCP